MAAPRGGDPTLSTDTPEKDETRKLLRDWQERGDRDALDVLLQRNMAFVHQRVRQRMGARLRGDAESLDLVQEVALDVLQYGPRFVATDSHQLRGLLIRMVENNLRDRARRRAAAKRDPDRERSRDAPSVDLAANQSGPATQVEGDERRELVRLAVELLDENDRAIVSMHQLEGIPMAEVADMLGIAVTTAHMRYKRALPRLALRIQELYRGESFVES